MRSHSFLAAFLAVLSLALAQDDYMSTVEEAPATEAYPFTRSHCLTYYGTSSRSSVPTSSYTSTSIRTINVTSVYNPIVTATPSATTTTGTTTLTKTSSTTTFVSQSPFTVQTPTSFRPFQALPAETASISALPIQRRIEDIGAVKALRLRQNDPTKSQAGFSVNPNGELQGISKVWPRRVHCDFTIVSLATNSVTVTGAPSTVFAAQPTETTFSTTTVTVTTTISQLLPRSTVHAACAPNNVVNSARQGNSSFDYNFWQIQYRPFIPVERQVITNTETAYGCCVACQNMVNCAGTFWHPQSTTCHISLSRAPTISNSTTGAVNGTQEPFCASGSRTVYLGEVHGSPFLPKENALVVSNGPCGRFSYRASA